MSVSEAAANRITEFLRQWNFHPGKQSDDIYGILFDPECDELVNLYASDIAALLARVKELETRNLNLAHQRLNAEKLAGKYYQLLIDAGLIEQ